MRDEIIPELRLGTPEQVEAEAKRRDRLARLFPVEEPPKEENPECEHPSHNPVSTAALVEELRSCSREDLIKAIIALQQVVERQVSTIRNLEEELRGGSGLRSCDTGLTIEPESESLL